MKSCPNFFCSLTLERNSKDGRDGRNEPFEQRRFNSNELVTPECAALSSLSPPCLLSQLSCRLGESHVWSPETKLNNSC
jgi:hypothetical protein